MQVSKTQRIKQQCCDSVGSISPNQEQCQEITVLSDFIDSLVTKEKMFYPTQAAL